MPQGMSAWLVASGTETTLNGDYNDNQRISGKGLQRIGGFVLSDSSYNQRTRLYRGTSIRMGNQEHRFTEIEFFVAETLHPGCHRRRYHYGVWRYRLKWIS